MEPVTSKNSTTCANSNNWKQVPANKTRTTKTTPGKRLQPQPIPTVINRYEVLNNLNNDVKKHHPRDASQEIYGTTPNYKKTTSIKRRGKVI
jgi:hypothetical protein